MKARVAVIDCSISNLTSVQNALEFLGAEVSIVREPDAIGDPTHVVLPGVGSFGRGMASLRESGLDETVRAAAGRGTPLIGLCLGMQLLGESGYEFGHTSGLGLLPGVVRKVSPSDPSLRLPHVGWNDVEFRRQSFLTRDLGNSATFYFVHSYAYESADSPAVLGTCEYGGPFAAVMEQENIFGAQFHPEKSQRAGLTLLRNFLDFC